MVHFCKGVVEEIQSAHNPELVDAIIHNSLVLFKETKSQDVSKYIINMIVMLRITRVDAKAGKEYDNVMRALEVFRKHQGTAGNLF